MKNSLLTQLPFFCQAFLKDRISQSWLAAPWEPHFILTGVAPVNIYLRSTRHFFTVIVAARSRRRWWPADCRIRLWERFRCAWQP